MAIQDRIFKIKSLIEGYVSYVAAALAFAWLFDVPYVRQFLTEEIVLYFLLPLLLALILDHVHSTKKAVEDARINVIDNVHLTKNAVDDARAKLEGGVQRVVQRIDAQCDAVVRGGLDAVYQPLIQSLDKPRPQEEKLLRVQGLTLAWAWQHLRRWALRSDESCGWTIQLRLLDPEFVAPNTVFSESWQGKCRSSYTDIRNFLASKEGAGLRESKNISIEIELYRYYPCPHGFAIGKSQSELFISFLEIEKGPNDKHVLSEPADLYEHFSAEEVSERAQFYRGLFDGWFSLRAVDKSAPGSPSEVGPH